MLLSKLIPLKVDNLISNKYVTILEACGRILNTVCVRIYFLPNVKNF